MTPKEYIEAEHLLRIPERAREKLVLDHLDIDTMSINEYLVVGLHCILTTVDKILKEFPELESEVEKLVRGK